MPRLRVLLSAFAFSPYHGSERGIGWEVVTRLARYHDVTVLCGDVAQSMPTQADLSRYFFEHDHIPGLTIRYIAPSRTAQTLEWLHGKPGLWPLYYAAYRNWQQQALVVAQQMHNDQPFELMHQLTYASYREPGYLWRLPVPFFWGPVGGAADAPAVFIRELGLRDSIGFCSRRVVNGFQRRFAFRSRRAAQKAELVWVTDDVGRRVIERWGGRAELQADTGTVPLVHTAKTRRPGEPWRMVWSGLHVPRKSLPIALRAVALVRERVPLILDVLGSGPNTQEYRDLADRLQLGSIVKWHGQVPRPEALRIMSESHVCLHSSLLENTSTVVLEALSLGLPVLCHDTCGMAEAITAQCGIKIPVLNPAISVQEFARAIARIDREEHLYPRLAQGAIQRAQELTWDSKVERMSEKYLEVTAARGSRESTQTRSASRSNRSQDTSCPTSNVGC